MAKRRQHGLGAALRIRFSTERSREPGCMVVRVRQSGTLYDTHMNPIGVVCRRSDGKYEHSMPHNPRVKHGSYPTQAKAIGALYRSWKSWVGF